MNTGTQAAKESGNTVYLDSNPTKLIGIVEIGKQLLITRGALTTFSLANDVFAPLSHPSPCTVVSHPCQCDTALQACSASWITSAISRRLPK